MNAERLLSHFERIADAPEATRRLRRFVLDLAVRGKLVLQDPKDEPATALLTQIEEKRARLIRQRETRNLENRVEIYEPPFQLPRNWTWTTFGALHQLVRGVTYSKSDVSDSPADGYVPVLRANNIGNVLTHNNPVFVKRACVSDTQFLKAGDFMIALSSGSKQLVGKAVFVPKDYSEAFGGFCGVIRLFDASLQGITRVYIQSSLYRESISAGSRGIGINNLKKVSLANLFFPLPPLAEQRRIVAKVDELMALCERLDALRRHREAVRDRVAAVSLARLSAPDSETFHSEARLALDALHTLTARADQIKQMRRTILNIAFHGKLVPQDPTDEPASELVKRIAAERAELIERGMIRREKQLDLGETTEKAFDVPANWLWARICDVVLFTQYGTSQKAESGELGVPVLTMGNLQDGTVVWNGEKKIPETSVELRTLFLAKFDILYNRTNSAELVGKTAIYLGDDRARTFASYLIRLRPSLKWTDPLYINFAMNAPEFRRTQIVPLIKKQTGQANVNGTALRKMLIPLPPLAEQRRIVAKVNDLWTLCGRLQSSLIKSETVRFDLLEALLHEALSGAEVSMGPAGGEVDRMHPGSEPVVSVVNT